MKSPSIVIASQPVSQPPTLSPPPPFPPSHSPIYLLKRNEPSMHLRFRNMAHGLPSMKKGMCTEARQQAMRSSREWKEETRMRRSRGCLADGVGGQREGGGWNEGGRGQEGRGEMAGGRGGGEEPGGRYGAERNGKREGSMEGLG